MQKWETYSFAGLTFEFGPDSEHCKPCLVSDMQEKFRKYVQPMVLVSKWNISVNWYLYAKKANQELENDRFKFLTGFHDVMLALNIFSFDSKGNWEIFRNDGGWGGYFNPSFMVSCNFRYSKDDMPLYFTRRKDAALFAMAIADKKRWLLRRVSDEIWDRDLVKKK